MMMTNEYIERILRENNLLGAGNNYFFGVVMPGILTQGLLGPILTTTQTTNFIVNKVDNNIVLIPCHKASNDALLDQKVAISTNEITKVIISKGNPGFSRATIYKDNEELFSIQVNNGLFEDVKTKSNFISFVNSFPNEGLDAVNNIKPRNPILKFLGYLLLLIIPFIGIYGVFFDETGEDFIIGVVMLGITVYYGIKIIKNKGLGKK